MAGAGYKLFNTGDVLTAAQVNTYLQEQTVMVFASSSARTTALSGVLAEGMMSYLQDTNAVEVYNGTSWVNVGNAGDITEVQAGVGISIASGTGPIPVITNSSTDLITTAGDILYGTAADTMARLGIGTAGQVLKVNSGATAPEWGTAGASFVGCLLTKTADQTITTATVTKLSFDSEVFDTDGFHSNTTNNTRITIPTGKGGKYQFHYQMRWATNNLGARWAGIYINNVEGATLTRVYPTQSAATIYNGSFVLDLVATDYVEIFAYQDAGSNLNIEQINTTQLAAQTRFGCTYLGA